MQWGMKFMGFGGQDTINMNYTQDIAKDTETTYSEDFSVEWEITCTHESPGEGVGLWQWVSETSDN